MRRDWFIITYQSYWKDWYDIPSKFREFSQFKFLGVESIKGIYNISCWFKDQPPSPAKAEASRLMLISGLSFQPDIDKSRSTICKKVSENNHEKERSSVFRAYLISVVIWDVSVADMGTQLRPIWEVSNLFRQRKQGKNLQLIRV